MKHLRKSLMVVLCVVLFITSVGFNAGFLSVYAAEATHTGTVKNVEPHLNIRSGPATTYNSIGQLYSGNEVLIYATEKDWYKIAFNNGYGFVHKDYIINIKEIPKYDFNADFEANLTKQKFPEDYKVFLRALNAIHPNWVFLADHLSMTFDEAVKAESEVGKSLVQNGAAATPDSYKSMSAGAYDWTKNQYIVYDSGGWVTAHKSIVEYYLEPRNFLNENDVYMFLEQSYNATIQNKEGLQKILNGTFMQGAFPETTYKTYNDVLMEAAKKSGVSPYVLAASIIIEQGAKGTGGSISGKIKGFEGIYNYFNVRAYASKGYDAVTYGLMYASDKGSLDRPWNTHAKSILGGAQHYANGYVKRGQNTLYYKKFNVITPDFYVNQYMANVQGAYLEASKLKNAYSSVNADAALTFRIPVYKNMPVENKTALPTSKGPNNYYLTALAVNGVNLEGFSMYNPNYEMVVESKVESIEVTAKSLEGATVSGVGKIALKHGKNLITITVTAASGKKVNYNISVFREGVAPDAPPEPTVKGSYKIGSYISGVTVGTTVADFVKNFGLTNGTVKVYDSVNKEKTTGVIASGDKVIVLKTTGEKFLELSIVLFADVNGDGKISIIDLARIQKHLLELNKLAGAQSTAADVNRDGKISILDLARVQKHLLEITQITQ